MVQRCVVKFCGNSDKSGHSIHKFPKTKAIRRLWIRFVKVKRADFELSPTSVICGAHFTKDSFSNLLKYEMGYCRRRELDTTAVPTIQPIVSDEQMAKERALKRKQTGTTVGSSKIVHTPCSASSTVTCVTETACGQGRSAKKPRTSGAFHKRELQRIIKESVKDIKVASIKVETNDDDDYFDSVMETGVLEEDDKAAAFIIRSISCGTQCERRSNRSRGVQVGISRNNTRNMAVQTVEIDAGPAPIGLSTPLHNPESQDITADRISLSSLESPVDEKGSKYSPSEESREEFEDDVTPHSSTEGPEEIRSADVEPKYIVFHSELVELLATCPLCTGRSRGVLHRTVGPLAEFKQTCTDCGFERTWNTRHISSDEELSEL